MGILNDALPRTDFERELAERNAVYEAPCAEGVSHDVRRDLGSDGFGGLRPGPQPKPGKLGAGKLTEDEQRRPFIEAAPAAGASEDEADFAAVVRRRITKAEPGSQ